MINISNSMESPKQIYRHGNKIIVTRNVSESTDEEGNISYTHEEYTMPSAPLKDSEQYLLDNYSAIRQAVILAHWPQEKQNEAITESAMGRPEKLEALETFITALKAEFPKS